MHDPGGKSRFPLKPGVVGAAYVSDDEKHRIWLSRIWGPGARYVCFVGANPSTADDQVDDPTLLRDQGYAQAWGYDGLFKVNVFSYRATDPRELVTRSGAWKENLQHPDQMDTVRKVALRCGMVVLCYGQLHLKLRGAAEEIIRRLEEDRVRLFALKLTQEGFPSHELYLKKDLKPFMVEALPHPPNRGYMQRFGTVQEVKYA